MSSGEDTWTTLQAHSDSLSDPEFRSCSSRCWSLLWAQIGPPRTGRPCTIWPKREENTCALIGEARNHRAMPDGRAAAAPIAMKSNWTTTYSYRFLKDKHINLLELERLTSLLRRITRGTCGFTFGLGSCLERTIELTKSQLLAPKIGVLVSCL